MKLKLFFLVAAIFTLTAVTHPPQTNASSGIKQAEMRFTAQDFSADPDGYTSPILEAPLEFNVIFSQWTADSASESQLQLQLRTSKSGDVWSDWQTIHKNEDWTTPTDKDIVGDMLLVPLPDTVHGYFQYRLTLAPTLEAIAPELSELHFIFMDSTDGLTAAEMLTAQKKKDATAVPSAVETNPKPTVVGRDIWCTDPDCHYSDGLYYSPVTHLIVHHTASSNYGTDYNWANVVRAVWRFHTYDRGWGDIGYNYLVDPNGVLYEGHLGGDDVVGTHSGDANTGGMALSFMGNFTDLTPSDAMLGAAIDLFAWKAEQKGIDVFDAGTMPYLDWGLHYLSGHRDVYGGLNTQCPGEKTHELLPWLRQEVADRIGLIDSRVYSEETSSDFSRSNPDLYWWTSEKGCGHNRNAFYTWSVTNPADSTNWGEWRPNLTADGRYQIDAYIPYCTTGRSETSGAIYEIVHAAGITSQTASQNDYLGLWMPLGEYDLLAGQETLIRLTDLTATDSNLGVWFDSLRLRPVGPIETTVRNATPEADNWQTASAVPFVWNLTAPQTIQTTTLQIVADADFSDIVFEQSWNTAVANYTHTFDKDYAALHWKVTLLLDSGETRQSVPTSFALDATLPTSLVTAVYSTTANDYLLYWQGSDNLSGLTDYTIEYQEQGATEWATLFANTTNVSGFFTPPIADATYLFRSHTADNAGNSEPLHEEADASTQDAILLAHTIMLPIVRR